jgi:membrane protein DedA with SNARE-associated domain
VFLLLAGLSELFDAFFGRFHYLAPFSILILCGLGAPLPEEVALIGAGILLYNGDVEFVPITIVCSSAILLGDSLPWWLGKRYGLAALRIRWVARILHPERFANLERRFREHGTWVVFTCRFLPGIRIPGYFFAGMMGVSYLRFLLLDLLGVLISVPTSIYLGKLFGESIENLQKRFDQLHLALGFAVVSLVLILVVRARVRKRDREAAEASRREEGAD